MKITNVIAVAAALLLAGAGELWAAEHESNIEKTFHVTNAGKLVIDADRGSINVKTDGADQVEIHVFRRVKGGSKEKADALFNNHEVTLAQDGNTVSIVGGDLNHDGHLDVVVSNTNGVQRSPGKWGRDIQICN